MKDVEKDFVAEMMMKTQCCEENVCTSCVCIASKKLRDKVKKSHHPVKKIYCEHCKENSINVHEFPQNAEDQNYKQVCGFFALFWIESIVSLVIIAINQIENIGGWHDQQDLTFVIGC